MERLKSLKRGNPEIARCYQAITYAYFRSGAFPRLRSFIKQDYMEGLDIVLALSALRSAKKRAPLASFIKEVLSPLLRENKDNKVRAYFKIFKELNGAGLLVSVLARELCFVEENVLRTTDYEKIDGEAESLLVFLDKIRQKKGRQS